MTDAHVMDMYCTRSECWDMLDYVRNVDAHVRDCTRGRYGVCMEVYVGMVHV